MTVYRQSMLNTWTKCGELFRYVYVEGRRAPPSVPLLRGTAVHVAAEGNLRAKRDQGAAQTDEQVCEAARDAFRRAVDEAGEVLGDEGAGASAAELGQGADSAVALASLHGRELVPQLQPRLIEEKFLLNVNGADWQLGGTIDLVEGTNLRDLKTRGKSPSGNEAASSVQLALYALATEALEKVKPERVWIDALVNLKKPKVVSMAAMPPTDYSPTLRRFEALHQSVTAGVFHHAQPDSWQCSERYCGFWHECPFGRAGRLTVPMN